MPLFDAIGRRTFVAGSEPWNANAFKLCGNFMISALIETYSEAFTALRKAGIDHQRFLEVMIDCSVHPSIRPTAKFWPNRSSSRPVCAEVRAEGRAAGAGIRPGITGPDAACESSSGPVFICNGKRPGTP